MRYDYDTWRENARGLFDITALGDRDRFFADAKFVLHNGLIFAWTQFSAQRFDRRPVLTREFDHDYLLFERYFRGIGRGVLGDARTRVDEQTLHLVDVSQPFCTITTRVETGGLWIPHAAVGYRRGCHPPYISCPLGSPRGQLLDHAFRMLATAFLAQRTCDVDELASAFLALVRTLLLGKRGVELPERSERGTARLLRGYIARNLDVESLGVEHLCRKFPVSRATLYRLFAEDGGVQGYIREQRLQQCLTQLLNAEPGRGQVRRIAERWGFHDPGHFNRSFRRRFGFAPSECLGADEHRPAHGNRGVRLDVSNWLRAR